LECGFFSLCFDPALSTPVNHSRGRQESATNKIKENGRKKGKEKKTG
jgi:hypothetical protein